MLVLFDIDDTLIDHSRAFRAATAAVHRHTASAISLDDFFRTWSTAHRRHFDRYLAGEITYEEQARSRVRDTVDSTLSDRDVDAIWATYYDSYEEAWTLFPDVLSCLDCLGGHRLGVISNGQGAQQRRKLEATGISRRFDVTLISAECASAKPATEIFLQACSAMGEPAQRAAYVGDLYDIDAEGARRAGLMGIWLDRTGRQSALHQPPIIRTLEELPDLLARRRKADSTI